MNFKYIIWILILVFSSFYISASIELTQPIDKVYNIGDKISLYLLIIPEHSLEGLLKVTLACEDKQLPFFITPITLIAKQQLEEKVPDLTVSKHILGRCRIIMDIISSESIIIEERVIENILTTNKLNLTFDKLSSYLPGHDIIFSGTLKDMKENNVKNASLHLNFNDRDYDVIIKNGNFKYPIKAPDNIKSGVHYITGIVEDQFGNKADTLTQLVIIPKPTLIDTIINKYTFLPSENVEVIIKLIDQNKELINDTIKIAIKNSKGNVIFSENAQSNTKFSYQLDQYAVPGAYIVRAERDEIFTEKIVNVTKVEKLDVSFEGNQLLIKNIGNVKYEDRANIVFESNGKKYILTKKLSLIPGEVIELELSKEVPEGNYSIGLEPADNKFTVNYQGYKLATDSGIKQINDVIIEDKRPLYKKILQGLLGITGGIVGAKDSITAPFYMLVLLIIILLIILYLHKKYFSSFKHIEEPLPKKSQVSKMLDKSLENKK